MSRSGPDEPVADRLSGWMGRADEDAVGRLGELDGLLELVATTIGARAVGFAPVDDVDEWARTAPAGGMTVGLDRRWSVAREAVSAPLGRAVRTTRPRSGRSEQQSFGAADAPVTVAAVAVHGRNERRVGAIVAHWVAAVAVPEEAWTSLELVAGHLGTVLDLRAESDAYHRFIELCPDPVFVLDDDGVIESANTALAALLQVESPAALRGRPFVRCIDPDDRARATSQIARLLAGSQEGLTLELTLRSDPGHAVPISIAATRLQGHRRRFQCTIHDLTERIEGEELRSGLSEKLARAERLDVVGQLAGGLAHDLHNLFAVVVANLELADETLAQQDARGDGQVEARSEIAEVRVAIDRAARLTGRLLEVGRSVERGVATTHVSAMLQRLGSLVERILPPGIAFRLEVGEALPEITAEAAQIERALLNLVLNGRDAIRDEGTITVRARAIRRTTSEPGDLVKGAVQLEVIDDGAGMDEPTRSRAFEPLFTTKGDRGSGLGLPAVGALVAALDGDIRLTSTPGDGTRVTLELPAVDGTPAPSPVGMGQLAAGPRVLLVEGGERTRQVIERMLAIGGYRVSVATTGSEAIRMVAEEPPALVVVDLALPDNGLALLDRLYRGSPGLPILAIAAIDAPNLLDVSPVLVKPFSHTRLLHVVRQVLRGSERLSRRADDSDPPDGVPSSPGS